jgi:hypothetical protein
VHVESVVKMAPAMGASAFVILVDVRKGTATASARTKLKRILEAFFFFIFSPARRVIPAVYCEACAKLNFIG